MPTIRKRGNRYQAQVRLKSKGVIVYEESATFDTQAAAKHWGVALERRLKTEGVDSHVNRTTTVKDLVLNWTEFKENIKPLSKGVQHSLKALMTAPFASKAVSALTARDIVTWGVELSKRGLNHATVLHHVMTLRSIYSSAAVTAGVDVSMVEMVKGCDSLKRLRIMAKSTSRERRITDDEIALLVGHLSNMNLSVPTDVYIKLAVALPRRREELLTMRWSDYTGKQIVLRDTKNPQRIRDEIVPVPPAARAIIDALPRYEGEDRIMPYKPESVSAAFQRAVKAVGLSDIRLHDLRHEGISRLFEQGLQIQEVALISGHTNWAMLKRYTHIKPNDVVEKLSVNSKRTQKDSAES